MNGNIILILAGILQFSIGYPVTGVPLSYAPGKTYKYAYTTETLLNELGSNRATPAQKDVGFSLSTHIELTPIWTKGEESLVKLVVSNPKLHSVAQQNIDKELKGLPRLPIFFQWNSGKISGVYAAEDDPTLTANLKKGIISLFQLHAEEGDRNENLYNGEEHKDSEALFTTQLDASGNCLVSYKVDNDIITKTKHGCNNTETVGEFKSVNPLFEPVMTERSETVYKIADDTVASAEGSESFEARLLLDTTLSTSITVKQSLKLEGSSKGKTYKGNSMEDVIKKISKESKLKLYKTMLGSSFEVISSQDAIGSPSDIISQNRDAFLPAKQASVASVQAYASLVVALRSVTKDEATKILKDPDHWDIIEAIQDAVTGAQTPATQGALMDFLDFSHADNILLPERYLLAVAFSTHPSEQLMQDLFGLFKQNVPNAKLRESVGEALGATLYTYCRMGHWDDQLVKDIQKALLDKMAACDSDPAPGECVAMLVRALRNGGLPETIPVLLGLAETSKDGGVSEAAIKALSRMGDDNLRRDEVRSAMKRIFHQRARGFDSAVRSRALDIILNTGVSEDEVRDILRETADPWNTEYDLYVQAVLYNLMDQDEGIKEKMTKILKEEEFRNWNFLAPKGKALTFTGYLARVPASELDSTYLMYVENSKPGIMKRSGMNVELSSPVQKLPMYNFGIFAAGLENLLGEEVEPGQEDVEATAGISLDLIDVSLRPISFFHGQSGLMGAVWSAPSEPTSALQGNLLLVDHSSRLHLQNGLVVQVQMTGAISMDLSGSMSLSLWNKNCKTLINNSGALVLRGSTSIESAPFRAGVTFEAGGASVIDFQTDVDFSDGIKMCLQMGRPEMVYRREVRKFEKAVGFKKSFKARITRTSRSPAISYPLPKRNNKQCRALFND